MAWKYRPYQCMECGNWTEYKQERELFVVTVDNVCIIHCAKQSHVLRHYSHWLLSKLHRRWRPLHECTTVEGQLSDQLYCVAVTCHTFLCVSSPGMYSANGTMWIKLELLDSSLCVGSTLLGIYMHTKVPCFRPHFCTFPWFEYCWQAYCLPFNTILS